MKKSSIRIWFLGIALMVLPVTSLKALVGPSTDHFEIDGDYGAVINGDGTITDDGSTTTYIHNGSGQTWGNYTSPVPYMGTNCYRSRCTASPDANNDRTEQKILGNWNMTDGIRYFSLSICVPSSTPDCNNWLFFSQWWQCDSWGPPLNLNWDATTHHIKLTRKYDSPPGTQVTNTLYDFGALTKDTWYNFLFGVQMGVTDGAVYAYQMDMATGVYQLVYSITNTRMGWQYLPDGVTAAPTDNFTWKIGTYRGYSSLTTDVFYDNCRYGRLWSHITKNSLTGYQKCVMNLQMDETTGTSASDASGRSPSHPGTLVNGPVWSSGGKVSNCLKFDGTNDYVQVPVDTTDFDTGNYLTISAWFNSTTSQTSKTIACMDDSGSNKFRLNLDSSTQLSFYVYYPDGGHDSVTASGLTSVLDGNWHHLVGVYNRFDPNGQDLKLYLDGSKQASNSTAYSKPLKRGDNYLYIGKYGSAYYKGYIDEVTMFNYPMTDSQVTDLYNNP